MAVLAALFAFDADQARDPNRYAGTLERLDAFLQLAVGNRHALPEANEFCPRRDDESLDESSVFAQIAKDAPARGTVPPSRSLRRVRRADEILAMLGSDLVLDLDKHRSIVG